MRVRDIDIVDTPGGRVKHSWWRLLMTIELSAYMHDIGIEKQFRLTDTLLLELLHICQKSRPLYKRRLNAK